MQSTVSKENYRLRRGKARLQQQSPTEALGCPVSEDGGELMEVTPEPSVVALTSPLPQLSWANSAELWGQMRAKDVSKMAAEQELCLHHPGILPSMRTILFDWLMEVSGGGR